MKRKSRMNYYMVTFSIDGRADKRTFLEAPTKQQVPKFLTALLVKKKVDGRFVIIRSIYKTQKEPYWL